jgi:HPt (histidine-containing phosphotransfer) domain-containing protein
MTIVTSESALYSTLASDPDLSELVELFVSELPDRIRVMQSALDQRDFEALGRFAHQLKGASGSYGFAQLMPALKQLELSARENPAEQTVCAALQEVADLCQRVRSGVPG